MSTRKHLPNQRGCEMPLKIGPRKAVCKLLIRARFGSPQCDEVAGWVGFQHDQSRYRILAPARGCGEVAE
jgi:hypothetical protein